VVADAEDLNRRELLIAGVLALLILAGGLYPQKVLDLTRSTSLDWVARIEANNTP
jgi:NADH-quinone oxidoreductase subunit M